MENLAINFAVNYAMRRAIDLMNSARTNNMIKNNIIKKIGV